MEPERYDGFVVSFFPFPEAYVNDICLYFKICVPIFAFITGYGLYLSYSSRGGKSTDRWLAKRYFKTFSGFWLIYVLVFLITMFTGYPFETYADTNICKSITNGIFDFLGLADLLGTPSMNATWWYMSAFIEFICAIPIFYLLERKFGCIAPIALVVILPRALETGFPGGTNGFSFILAVVFGMLFAKYQLFKKHDELVKDINKGLLFVVDVLILAASIYLWIRLDKTILWEYHYAIAPTLFIIFMRRYILRNQYVCRFFGFLGKHSMNIFLTHTFIRVYFFRAWTYSFGSFWLIALILLVESLAISLVIEGFKKLIKFDDRVYNLLAKI